MRYTSYPAYTPALAHWLERYPSTWMEWRLKFGVSQINDKVDSKECDLEYMGLENIEPWTGKRFESTINESIGIATKFEKNDVLFGKLRPYLAKVFRAEQTGIATTEALVLRAESKINPQYLKYYLLSKEFVNVVDGSTYGSKMPRASWDFIGNLSLLLPSLEEQAQIANFLDYKTAQIDNLIAKKKELIEKLNEKRIAVITHAVTKGLDPKVTMKDSGVEWLGEVPEHWEVLQLRRVIKSVKTGGTPAGVNNTAFDEDGFNWYSPADFFESIIIAESTRKLSEEGKNEVRIFPAMTVMFVGIGATIGKVCISLNECSCNQQINGIVCDSKLNPIYATYYLRTLKDFIVKCGKYTTLPIINQEETKNIVIVVPKIDEQVNIVNFLEKEIIKIDALILNVEKVIDKLQEYRTSLITAAVTGKIDVRNYKIPSTSKNES